jgi:YD repeat-containing protein
MVQDGAQWFGDYTTNQTITILSNYDQPHSGGLQYGSLSDLFASRVAPEHRTGQPGEDLLSGNFNWGLGLVGLAGRSGLNLNLGLSYNSLAAWTKVIPPPSDLPPQFQQPVSWTFDADRGFPSVGFRLGFPTIQGPFYNNQTAGSSYLMLLPSGGRVELRQVRATNVYEAVDSSYIQLLDGGNGSLLLRTTDGSQFAYWSINSEYRCTEVKDRNGNYLSIKYDPINGIANLGRMTSVIDTLGRTLNFNYDPNYRLQSITQLRNGQTHVWATFGYATLNIETNFSESSPEEGGELEFNVGPEPVVLGLPANHMVSVLTQVGLDDGSRYNFDYTSWGQVYRIKRFAADGHQLNSISYNLPLDNSVPQTECPRFTQKQESAENWNNGNPVVATFQVDPGLTWGQVTTAAGTPDEVTYKEYFSADYTDWKRGLTTRTEIYTPNSTTPKKTTVTDWAQDVTNVNYPLNPRPTAITISDAEGNRRRTTIEYGEFGLPSDIYEMGPYGTNEWRTLRRTHTDYNLSEAYINRRIVGLVAGQYLFAPDAPNSNNIQTLLSKTTFDYDHAVCSPCFYTFGPEGQEILEAPAPIDPVVHHDSTYNGGFQVGRGLLAKTLEWDVSDATNASKVHTSSMTYNVYGSMVRSQDPLLHANQILYQDSFSNDGISNNPAPYVTMAYPTTIFDADKKASATKYNYDLGFATSQQDPKGAQQTTEYDKAGRTKQVTNQVNGAYTRFVYPLNQTVVNKFTTFQQQQGEAYSATVVDGNGRVRAMANDFPGSTGQYRGQFKFYDVLGRAVRSTNPTEMNYSWSAAGDDYAGWHASTQTYDWKGRPLVTTNTDGTLKQASYGGCGCAGGEVVTLTDEGTIDAGVAKRRQQKIYSDSLGRATKTEIQNWQGGSVYSATVNTFNARDQITLVRQFAGAPPTDPNDLSCPTGNCQKSVMTYDGYGRLKTKHLPEQKVDPLNTASTDYTAFDYYDDNTIRTTIDARGARVNFWYNNRRLVTNVTYDVLPGVPSTGASAVMPSAPVSFGYDNVGNRTSMTDAFGSKTYEYDALSRLKAEIRTFNSISNPNATDGKFKLSYEYNLDGELTKIIDASNVTINYGYDRVGRLNGITGPATPYVGSTYASNLKYRAWGAIKEITDGNNHTTSYGYNSRLQLDDFELSPNVVNQNYDYYSDGRISAVHNTTDGRFDNSYQYDHRGKLIHASSGHLASSVPYDEIFDYDAFGHTTRRVTDSWSQEEFLDLATYADDRRDGWVYDADGRLKTINARTYSYDAAGRNVNLVGQLYTGSSYTVTSIPMGFDGDGNKVQETVTYPNSITTYYLTSEALGGAVVEELNSSGQKNVAYIYTPAGELFAKQSSDLIWWKHVSPAGSSEYEVVNSNVGEHVNHKELDPLGASTGLNVPNPHHHPGETVGDLPGGAGGPLDSRSAAIENPGAGCLSLNGNAIPCDWLTRGTLGWIGLLSQPVGSRTVGVHWGTPFQEEYRNGNWTVSEGQYNSELAQMNYGVTETLFETANIGFSTVGVGKFHRSSLPQNPVPLSKEQNETLLQDFANLLKTRKDCLEFMSSLLQTVATNTGRSLYSTEFISDPTKIFTALQKGAALKPDLSYGGAQAWGSLGGGDAMMVIRQISWTGFSFVRGMTAAHESGHFAAAQGKYTDQELGWAGYQVLWAQGYTKLDPPPSTNDVMTNSYYYDSLLFKACNPFQKKE